MWSLVGLIFWARMLLMIFARLNCPWAMPTTRSPWSLRRKEAKVSGSTSLSGLTPNAAQCRLQILQIVGQHLGLQRQRCGRIRELAVVHAGDLLHLGRDHRAGSRAQRRSPAGDGSQHRINDDQKNSALHSSLIRGATSNKM